MFFKKTEKFHPAEVISRTIFLVSLISFAIFLLGDLWQPGFVSRVFSVHWFLFSALISGIWWGSLTKESRERSWLQWILAFIFGLIGIYLAWQFRTDLKDYLILVLPLALIVPFLVIWIGSKGPEGA